MSSNITLLLMENPKAPATVMMMLPFISKALGHTSRAYLRMRYFPTSVVTANTKNDAKSQKMMKPSSLSSEVESGEVLTPKAKKT
mmetsp:Transcript_16367/g.19634  ORF Transcript_16367/g.19634 Transcript_16367/m.19634 type:complete len:85 (+) Transcript_16367:595-849(+)